MATFKGTIQEFTRYIGPYTRIKVSQIASKHKKLIAKCEECGDSHDWWSECGGFGSHVLHYLAEAGLLDHGLKVRSMVLPDDFIDHDSPNAMYERAGLQAPGIVETVLAALGRQKLIREAGARTDR